MRHTVPSVVSTHYHPDGISTSIVNGVQVDRNFQMVATGIDEIKSMEARLCVVENRLSDIAFDLALGAKLVEHMEREHPEVMAHIRGYLTSEAAKKRILGS